MPMTSEQILRWAQRTPGKPDRATLNGAEWRKPQHRPWESLARFLANETGELVFWRGTELLRNVTLQPERKKTSMSEMVKLELTTDALLQEVRAMRQELATTNRAVTELAGKLAGMFEKMAQADDQVAPLLQSLLPMVQNAKQQPPPRRRRRRRRPKAEDANA